MATLKSRFTELIHINWQEFVELEQSKDINIDDSVLCSLIRACADTDDISAIKLAFDRIDGLLETPVEIRVPKFYVRYINAKDIEPGGKQLEASETVIKEPENDYDPATAKLRETLIQMRTMPRDTIRVVRLYKKRIDEGKKVDHEPMVKSVIVANLLKNVAKGKFKAVELVFDQIDGKLTRTINLLGGKDVVVDDPTPVIAPAHAQLDEDGYYRAEDEVMTASWLRGFANSQKGLESLVEGLGDD